jgi:hypothetical protein
VLPVFLLFLLGAGTDLTNRQIRAPPPPTHHPSPDLPQLTETRESSYCQQSSSYFLTVDYHTTKPNQTKHEQRLHAVAGRCSNIKKIVQEKQQENSSRREGGG